MTVKLKLEQSKVMKTIVDAMTSVSDDVAIEISNNGFRAQAIDVGNALAMDAFLDRSIFTNIDAPESGVFHVDLASFSDFIKTSKSDDVLFITDNEQAKTLDLKLKSSNMTKRIALRLNDVQNHRFMKIIDRPFFSECEMDAELFSDAIKASELGDEHVTLYHSKDKLHFSALSTTRTAEATIHYDNNDKIRNVNFKSGTFRSKSGDTLEIPEVHKATFSLKYLKRISRISKTYSTLKLSMSDKQPLRIVYSLEDEQGYIVFAVAPRLLDDELV